LKLGKSISHLFFANFWDSVLFWRSLTLIIFTLVIIAFLFGKRLISFLLKPKRLAHDKDIFKHSNKLMTEADLLDFWDRLQTDDSYNTESSFKIGGFLLFFKEESNQYLTPILRKTSLDFVSSLNSLMIFLAQHFFVYPSKQTDSELHLHLYPELYERSDYDDAARTRYFKFQKDLDNHVTVVREKYKQYRSIVKKILYI